MSTIDDAQPLMPYALRHVTEAAAIAAHDWIGRGDKDSGDGAAVQAMRQAFDKVPCEGTIIIGEGEKDEAPMLYQGEVVGRPGHSRRVDIAVDPVEGTTYLAKGLPNSMAVVASAPAGTMFKPGPAFYMDKFAAPSAVKGQIDPTWPVPKKLEVVARELGKKVRDLTVFVIERPRHKTLMAEIYQAGARVALYPAGDVAGALLAMMPDDERIDILMGTGGTPEGVSTACAARALDAAYFGRMDPQRDDEKANVEAAGMDVVRWYSAEELVASEDTVFCATGITDGMLFHGVKRQKDLDIVQTLLISAHAGARQLLQGWIAR